MRKLLNCEEVFDKYNFFTMVPGKFSICEQIKYFYYADIIVCPHGAALANSCFMRKGTTFIELFPRSWINATAFHMLHYRGVHYRMLVEGNLTIENCVIDSHRDFCIDEKLLEYTIKDSISLYD